METTRQASFQALPPLKYIKAFYTKYPPEKAQCILWHWFILSIKNEFSTIHPKEMEGFEDFFESLSNLVSAVALVHRQEESRTELLGIS